jgi:hypothetical protein
MARPSQFQYPESDSMAVAKAKQVLKKRTPEVRTYVMAWFVKYFDDSGGMFPSLGLSSGTGAVQRREDRLQHPESIKAV